MSSPTARTLERLRSQAPDAEKVEHWNQWAHRRHDLWGCDVAAIHPDYCGTLYVQCCMTGDQAARIKKLLGIAAIPRILRQGNSVEVWGWGKYKLKRGGKAVRWRVTRTSLQLTPGGEVVTKVM